jgi:hypothetical protein
MPMKVDEEGVHDEHCVTPEEDAGPFLVDDDTVHV